MKANDSSFNVLSKRKESYVRSKYRKQVKQRDETAN